MTDVVGIIAIGDNPTAPDEFPLHALNDFPLDAHRNRKFVAERPDQRQAHSSGDGIAPPGGA
jgi:hypothetical protein